MFEDLVGAVIWPEPWRRDAKRDEAVISGWRTGSTSFQLLDDREQLVKPRV